MDPKKLEGIRKDTDAALAEIAKKHGLSTYRLGKITYSKDGFRAPVEAVELGALSEDAKLYKSSEAIYGLPPVNVEVDVPRLHGKITPLGMTGRGSVLFSRGGATYKIPFDRYREVFKSKTPVGGS
jgi:hypothetical protein